MQHGWEKGSRWPKEGQERSLCPQCAICQEVSRVVVAIRLHERHLRALFWHRLLYRFIFS
jgi:hypothetical protein